MASKLIIIRGNSGSGKTTVAKRVQHELGKGTMLVPQDILRREIVWVRDGADNPSIELIKRTVLYGKEIGYDVILEGILAKKFHDSMINELIEEFAGNVRAYYFDLSFDETLSRHATKPNAQDFGISGEQKIWVEESEEEIVARIVNDCRH